MSLNGLHCLSETFSNEHSDTKWFQFVMHVRQNWEEKSHLLFPTGLLKAPDWQAWEAQRWVMFFVFQTLACWGWAWGRVQQDGALPNCYRPMIHTQPRQQTVREAPSMPGTVLGTGGRKKRIKGHEDERDTEHMGQEWVVHPASWNPALHSPKLLGPLAFEMLWLPICIPAISWASWRDLSPDMGQPAHLIHVLLMHQAGSNILVFASYHDLASI